MWQMCGVRVREITSALIEILFIYFILFYIGLAFLKYIFFLLQYQSLQHMWQMCGVRVRGITSALIEIFYVIYLFIYLFIYMYIIILTRPG